MKELHILGGGFAGVWAAMSAASERDALKAEQINIRLFSNDSYLTIRPRLYQGACDTMRVPLAPLLHQIGVEFTLGEVTEVDVTSRSTILSNTTEHKYDRLILATGSQLKFPNIPGAKTFTFSADNFDEAKRLDEHLKTISKTESTIVVVGASFTGLEIATELRVRLGAEIQIVLIDSEPKVGSTLGDNPQPYIAEALLKNNIVTYGNVRIEEITPNFIRLNSGKVIDTTTVILATGMTASPLTQTIPGKYDSQGRLKVDLDLAVVGAPDIFAAGDTARAYADDEHKTYMSCQHATELGKFAGYNAIHSLTDQITRAYRQEFYATCIDLGSWGALFTTGWERTVEKTGEEGKGLKQQINNEWIYPPLASIGKKQIFKSFGLNKGN
nr:FAD-dependent oxidoreductase [uncultured Vibrio sp.]